MVKVLITGGTGLIGQHLCKALKDKGYKIALLSRSGKSITDIPTYFWDPEKKQIDKEAIETADFIINLAGANIGEKRWTPKQRKLIIDSRVKTTQFLFEKIKESKNVLKAFVSASATGYYGISPTDKIFRETDPPADDFLGNTCAKWEQAVDRFKELGIRTVKLRMGVVLTKQGGALAKMIVPVKLGLASTLGNGRQFLPWIHIDDLCAAYISAIENLQMNGAYNAVAPEHTTNNEFTRTLAQVMNKPFWFPGVPGIMIRIMLGKMSQVILKGNRVSSDKIIASGFKFRFPHLEGAIKDLLTGN